MAIAMHAALPVLAFKVHDISPLSLKRGSAPRELTRALIYALMDVYSLQGRSMAISSKDIVPMNQVRARLTELAEEVRAGSEKIVTLNGESYIALVDARRLDHYHRLEREHIHLTLLDEAAKGLEDIEQGRTLSVAQARAKYKVSKKR
jgi:antitoxin (DNA-binding transcriptional repressor) of toxin-antitoxin stability system